MFQLLPLLALLASSAEDPAVAPASDIAGTTRPNVTSGPSERSDLRATTERLRVARAAIESARSAYLRGLMPLHDYAVHVRSVRSGLPTTVGDRFAQDVYVEVVRRLERLSQPASIGWAADLAEASARLAAARGDAFDEQTALSDRAIALRINDLRIGHASPADVAKTMSGLASRGGGIGVVRRRDELANRSREFWAKQWRSGVGRTDELILARLASESVDAGERWRLANRAFDAALRFHKRGTASLFDVTNAYEAVVREYRDLPKPEREARHERWEALRRGLAATADGVTDPRGRNRADLALAARLLDEPASPSGTGPTESRLQPQPVPTGSAPAQ